MAISLKLVARPTDDDILRLAERNPGLRIEQDAAGGLILTPTGAESGRRELVLGRQLDEWAESDGRGVAFGSGAGFRLPDGSLRCPDASWVRKERWAALTPRQRERFAPLCPDAVFEIRSHSDALRDLRIKMRTYLTNGALLAVLIDPQRRAVEIYMPDRQPQVLGPAHVVSLDPILPGFTLDLRRIFG